LEAFRPVCPGAAVSEPSSLIDPDPKDREHTGIIPGFPGTGL
jgi:hypothetical protein